MNTRLAVVRDFRAERWPSMDLCADQLLVEMPLLTDWQVTDLETPFRRRFQKLAIVGRGIAFNADRLLNRHWILPRFLKQNLANFDYFHIVDHSYAHLVHAVPPGRAGVYCHDLDAFRSLIQPERERRPWWFRRLARRTLEGLRQAAVVFHNSRVIGQEILAAGIVPAEKLVHAPLGVAREFTQDAAIIPAMPVDLPAQYVLHVGSSLPRKRLDVLLDVFGIVHKSIPGLRLLQVGGPWPQTQVEQMNRLGIESAVTQVRGLSREQLALLYRRAAVVLVTSESEGFGLPVIEALACGARVLASDLPVLREVGGSAVSYCPVADIAAWSQTLHQLLNHEGSVIQRDERLAQASRYTWREHARIIADTYRRLAAGLPIVCASSS